MKSHLTYRKEIVSFLYVSRQEQWGTTMNKPLHPSEIETQVEFVSTDLIRAEDEKKALRKKLLIGFAVTLILAGGGYAAYDVLAGGRYVTTDNAYVGADIAHVTPLLDAPVTEVRVTDTDMVRKGDILV